MKRITILLVILGFFVAMQTSFAQIRIKSIQAGGGAFTRTYNGNDETRMFSVFDIEGVPSVEGIRTTTQLLPSVGAEVGLTDWLSLDARLGVLNKEFTASQVLTGITIEETISQRILPVSVGVKWISGDLFVDRIAYFAGGGVNRYFVQNRIQRVVIGGEGSVLPATYAGNNYGVFFQAGVDYLFDNNLSIGIDGRYHTGNYVQNYTDTEGRRVRLEVPIQGFEFGLVLKYNFGRSSGESGEEDTE